jgi:hypothetical protein
VRKHDSLPYKECPPPLLTVFIFSQDSITGALGSEGYTTAGCTVKKLFLFFKNEDV